MGYHERRQLIVAYDLIGKLKNLFGRSGVESRSVLVQKQQLRGLKRSHEQRQRLALAAGEQTDLGGESVLKAEA